MVLGNSCYGLSLANNLAKNLLFNSVLPVGYQYEVNSNLRFSLQTKVLVVYGLFQICCFEEFNAIKVPNI